MKPFTVYVLLVVTITLWILFGLDVISITLPLIGNALQIIHILILIRMKRRCNEPEDKIEEIYLFESLDNGECLFM